VEAVWHFRAEHKGAYGYCSSGSYDGIDHKHHGEYEGDPKNLIDENDADMDSVDGVFNIKQPD
jgi:hypothetical protein